MYARFGRQYFRVVGAAVVCELLTLLSVESMESQELVEGSLHNIPEVA